MEVQRFIFDLVFDFDIPNCNCISNNINDRILEGKLINSYRYVLYSKIRRLKIIFVCANYKMTTLKIG